MPSRVLRDGILDSKRVAQLSERAELFYRKLFSLVDDYGRYEADIELLHVKLYARRLNQVSASDVAGFLDECCKAPDPLIQLYEVQGKKLLQIHKFGQRVRTKKYPDPPTDAWPPNGFAANCGQLTADAGACAHLSAPGGTLPTSEGNGSQPHAAASNGAQIAAETRNYHTYGSEPDLFERADNCAQLLANARLARASTTTTTTTTTGPQASRGDESLNTVSPRLDSFGEFWARYCETTGKPVTEADYGRAREEWQQLAITDQLHAVAYIPQYLAEAAPSHPRFCKTPAAYLRDRPWTAVSLKPPQRESAGIPLEEIV